MVIVRETLYGPKVIQSIFYFSLNTVASFYHPHTHNTGYIKIGTFEEISKFEFIDFRALCVWLHVFRFFIWILLNPFVHFSGCNPIRYLYKSSNQTVKTFQVIHNGLILFNRFSLSILCFRWCLCVFFFSCVEKIFSFVIYLWMNAFMAESYTHINIRRHIELIITWIWNGTPNLCETNIEWQKRHRCEHETYVWIKVEKITISNDTRTTVFLCSMISFPHKSLS